MKAVLCFALLGVAVRADAQFGGVRVEQGGVCPAIAAELRAIGVQITPFATRVVTCRPRIEFRDGDLVIEFANVGSSDVLAARVAEAVRARLLRIDVPEPSRAELDLASEPELLPSPTPEPTAEPVTQPVAALVEPLAERGRDSASPRLFGSTFAELGGVFGRSALLPSAGGAVGVALHVPRLLIRAALGGYVLSSGVEVFADDSPESATLSARLLEVRASASFVHRLPAAPLSFSVGAGLSALRVSLRATTAPGLGLQGSRTRAWTAVPFATGGLVVHVTERWALRGSMRVGVYTRAVTVLPPEGLADFSSLAFERWWLSTALALEVSWGE